MHINRYTASLDERGMCKYCRIYPGMWGGHESDCPHEQMEMVERNVCIRPETGSGSFVLCLPCLEYGSNKWNVSSLKGSSINHWLDNKYHTSFCVEYRELFGNPGSPKSKEPEELPKIKKAPRPESET